MHVKVDHAILWNSLLLGYKYNWMNRKCIECDEPGIYSFILWSVFIWSTPNHCFERRKIAKQGYISRLYECSKCRSRKKYSAFMSSSSINLSIRSILIESQIAEQNFYCEKHCFGNHSCIVFFVINVLTTERLMKTSKINEQIIK